MVRCLALALLAATPPTLYGGGPEGPRPSPSPSAPPTAQQRSQGTELIARALQAFGGAAAVDAVSSLEVRSKGTRAVQGSDLEVTTITRYFHGIGRENASAQCDNFGIQTSESIPWKTTPVGSFRI